MACSGKLLRYDLCRSDLAARPPDLEELCRDQPVAHFLRELDLVACPFRRKQPAAAIGFANALGPDAAAYRKDDERVTHAVPLREY